MPWASWSPDGKQLPALYRRQGKIRIFDLQTKLSVKEMPRQGIFQQLYWSPDGKRVCGTANLNGQDWNVVSIDLASGKMTLLSRYLNCHAGLVPKRCQSCHLFQSHPRCGKRLRMDHAHASHRRWTKPHLALRRTGTAYLLWLHVPRRSIRNLFRSGVRWRGRCPMVIIRLADSPIIAPENYAALKSLYPNAKKGPILSSHPARI